MKVTVKNMAGQEVSTQDLPASIFEADVNVGLMHQALVRQMANARRGTHKTKGRSEVRYSTRKIYRQKGTGNARHGSRRAPIFVGGGIAHGTLPRDYSKNMPRKMRRAALRSALTVKASEGDLVLVDAIQMEAYKTKEVAAMVERLVGDNSALIIIPGPDEIVEKSARNLSDVKTLRAHYLNVRDLLGHDKLLVSVDALDVLTSFLDVEGYEFADIEEAVVEDALQLDSDDSEAVTAEQAEDDDQEETEVVADDLKMIEGIGPKIASVLASADITTFAHLAERSVDDLKAILEDKVRIAHPDTWPEQAALAAAGKWDELKALQDTLDGGRKTEEAEE